MKKINIGIVGYGVVGSSVVKILDKDREIITQKSDLDINVKKVYTRNWNRRLLYPIDDSKKAKTVDEIINDKDIDIVVEVAGGIEFPYQLITQAIKNRKNIVTANKALLAEKGKDIFSLAQKYDVRVGFEAAVAGGIPIIKALREGLVANDISKIYGILNGTTNYILTSMYTEGKSFEQALKEAQEKGYAEADPTLDINGTDAAHKISILASLSFGGFVDFSQVYVEGIDKIDTLDIELGRELGYTLKLLAIAKSHGEEVEIRVNPTFLPSWHPLSKVDGVFNAVMVEGNNVGETMFYGRGAGGLPTASAVISDIVCIGKSIANNLGRDLEITSMDWKHKDLTLTKVKDFYTRYYIRFTVPDITGILAKIASVFAKYNISIAAVIQKEKVLKLQKETKEKVVPLVILTHTASENNIQLAIKEIVSNKYSVENPVIIRVEDEE